VWSHQFIRFRQPLRVEGLQQIIERVNLEGPNRVLVESGDENNLKLEFDPVNKLEAGFAGHPNVEEDDVGPGSLYRLDRGINAVGLTRQSNLSMLRQQRSEIVASQTCERQIGLAGGEIERRMLYDRRHSAAA
jgi:hypothetical protein